MPLQKLIKISFFFLFVLLQLQLSAQMSFTENKGQWDSRVLFQTTTGNGAMFLSSGGYTILQHHPEDYKEYAAYYHGHATEGSPASAIQKRKLPPSLRSHAYRVQFIGSSPNPEVVREKVVPGYNNYFIGHDPSKWASGCRSYQAVTLKNMYPGIDLRYYILGEQLKYDLIVHAGADWSRIRLRYEGAESLFIQDRELIIKTSVGEARELKPYSYQYREGRKEEVSCRYRLSGNILGFDIKNADKGTALVIDPSLVFSSFSGSGTDNWGFTATPGPDGSMFGGGIASVTGFPVTPGAFQSSGSGPNSASLPPDIGIIKLAPDGRGTPIFSTYIGGDGLEQPHSLIADSEGNLVIAGRTNSGSSFPGSVLFGSGGSYDIFVCKLNATGTALIGSVRIGGSGDDGVNITSDRQNGPQSLLRNYGDDGRSEVILDRNNNILVASCTQSQNFFTLNAFQSSPAGEQEGVVIKINPSCTTPIWSTYLGGDQDDASFVLTTDPLNNDIYVAGGTGSANFPGTGGSVLQPTYNGGLSDGYLAQLRDNGNAVSMVRSTYLGTNQIDIVYGVQFDQQGFPYVMGTSTGNWPVVNATYSNTNARQFIAKLRPDLSNFVYSTTFGSVNALAPNISPVAFLVDNCENVYVSGWGGGANNFANPNYPSAGTSGMPVTPDAFQSQTDGSDFYFFVLKKNATGILYGSFFGQRGGNGGLEHVDGGTSRFDAQGIIYQAACANCKFVPSGIPPQAPYPITAGVFGNLNTANGGGGCNLGMIKLRFDLSGIDVSLKAVGARQLNFCLPSTIEFRDTLQQGKQYIWIWGDGTKNDTTTANPNRHTYSTAGAFDVKVIGIDSNTCNIKDSSILRIRVTTDSVDLKFSSVRLPPCNSLTYEFTNTTNRLNASPPFTPRSFVWEWGDGTPNDTIGGFVPPAPIRHTFPGPGTYSVRLILIDSNFCNLGDTFGITNFQVASTIRAGFEIRSGCIPYNISVRDTSFGAVTYLWVSSDGQRSTNITPNFVYNTPGSYTIRQYISNPNSCNLIDSATRVFEVFTPPQAAFTYTPNPSQDNTPTRFLNGASADVIQWEWNFGDGTTSAEVNPVHQFTSDGNFNVCQVVTNARGCRDTVCIPVRALVTTNNDLPSAFTPNGDGVNDIFRVRGFGIINMTLRVYNRQGLMVFESRSQSIGWDGNYKGVPQPMDAYAWTLDLEYFTGEKVRKKGDVTLIR